MALRRDRVRLWIALPLSLFGHAAAIGLWIAIATLYPRPVRPKAQPVSIRSIGGQWASNRRLTSTPGHPSPPRPTPNPRGQVVDVAPGNNRESENAKYLAETSNTVKKETRAREQTPVYSRATPTTQPNPEAALASRGQAGGRTAPPLAGVRAIDRLNGIGGVRPRLSLLETEATASQQEQNLEAEDKAGAESGDRAGQSTESGGGAPNDDLNVDKGEGTFLNTREWKYASFFNRVKQAVSARWDPMGRLRSRQAQVGYSDRVTVLNVALRPDGSIREIFVAQSSGLDYLDQESIQAFEKAQPFANPPAGLVQDGVIRFAFGFKLTNDEPGVPRMFRFGG
jgi:TonB family protein